MMKKHDLIDVSLVLMQDDPDKKAIAVWNGEFEDGKPDPNTGEIRSRRKWIWLPRSMIEYEEEGKDSVLVTLPEWLAIERRLI